MFWSGLGWYWVVVPLAVAALGLLIVFRGFGHMAGGRAGSGGARLAAGAPLSILGLAVGLLALNTQSFARLTYESTIATVTIKAADAATGIYDVTVKRLDIPAEQAVTECRLQGDEWEMSARVQKWKSWANVLGLDTTYTLDQMSNRYFDAERANGKMITSCNLKGPPPAINQYIPKSWVFWLASESYTEQRRFGSAAYMPLADGAVYNVIITQSGLNAEPANDTAKAANDAHP